MDRRDMILSTAAMAVSASLGAIACGAANATAQGVATIPRDAAAALTDLALDCQKKGAACLEHCDRLIAAGDTSMVECEANVRDMLAVTEMLAKLAKPGFDAPCRRGAHHGRHLSGLRGQLPEARRAARRVPRLRRLVREDCGEGAAAHGLSRAVRAATQGGADDRAGGCARAFA